jgi:GT2 family glycosyltransferase
MQVGAVIVTHDQVDLAIRCARLVGAQIGARHLVVVVNDRACLTQARNAMLQSLAGSVIVNDAFAGYGANLNRGVKALPSDVEAYLLLNDDAFPREGAIGALVDALESDRSAGLIGPRFVGADGAQHPSAYRFPTVRSEMVAPLLLPVGPRRWMFRRWVLEEPATTGPVDWVVGAAILARATAYHAVGGFDESFFLYSEETDLARRMRSRGWHAVHCPDAVVVHIGGVSIAPAATEGITRARGHYIETHWRARDRLALAVALPAVFAFNFAATIARTAPDVQSLPARWTFFRQQVRGRPRFRVWPRVDR